MTLYIPQISCAYRGWGGFAGSSPIPDLYPRGHTVIILSLFVLESTAGHQIRVGDAWGPVATPRKVLGRGDSDADTDSRRM